MTDINFGISPTPIEQSKSIYISSEKLSIKHHNYEDIILSDFLTSLIDLPLERRIPKNIKKFSDKSNIHRVSHSHFEAKKIKE